MLTNCLAVCTHVSTTVSQIFEPQVPKNAIFTYRRPHCFPWRCPCDYHAICCMNGKTIQCLPNPSNMYLSIFNSFRVIRCLSQCVSPKIAIFYHIFVSPGNAPGTITLNVVWMKENAMLTNCVAACANLSITISEIQRDICEKIVILSYPLAFDAPFRGVPIGISAPPLEWKDQNGVAIRR